MIKVILKAQSFKRRRHLRTGINPTMANEATAQATCMREYPEGGVDRMGIHPVEEGLFYKLNVFGDQYQRNCVFDK